MKRKKFQHLKIEDLPKNTLLDYFSSKRWIFAMKKYMFTNPIRLMFLDLLHPHISRNKETHDTKESVKIINQFLYDLKHWSKNDKRFPWAIRFKNERLFTPITNQFYYLLANQEGLFEYAQYWQIKKEVAWKNKKWRSNSDKISNKHLTDTINITRAENQNTFHCLKRVAVSFLGFSEVGFQKSLCKS